MFTYNPVIEVCVDSNKNTQSHLKQYSMVANIELFKEMIHCLCGLLMDDSRMKRGKEKEEIS